MRIIWWILQHNFHTWVWSSPLSMRYVNNSAPTWMCLFEAGYRIWVKPRLLWPALFSNCDQQRTVIRFQREKVREQIFSREETLSKAAWSDGTPGQWSICQERDISGSERPLSNPTLFMPLRSYSRIVFVCDTLSSKWYLHHRALLLADKRSENPNPIPYPIPSTSF